MRIQAVYEKQKDAIGKRIAHLTRKIETTRKKVNEIAEKLPDRLAPFKVQNGLGCGVAHESVVEAAPVNQLVVPPCTSRSCSESGLAEDDPASVDEINESGSNRTSLIDPAQGLNLEVLSAHSEGKGESRDSLPGPISMDNLNAGLMQVI